MRDFVWDAHLQYRRRMALRTAIALGLDDRGIEFNRSSHMPWWRKAADAPTQDYSAVELRAWIRQQRQSPVASCMCAFVAHLDRSVLPRFGSASATQVRVAREFFGELAQPRAARTDVECGSMALLGRCLRSVPCSRFSPKRATMASEAALRGGRRRRRLRRQAT